MINYKRVIVYDCCVADRDHCSSRPRKYYTQRTRIIMETRVCHLGVSTAVSRGVIPTRALTRTPRRRTESVETPKTYIISYNVMKYYTKTVLSMTYNTIFIYTKVTYTFFLKILILIIESHSARQVNNISSAPSPDLFH